MRLQKHIGNEFYNMCAAHLALLEGTSLTRSRPTTKLTNLTKN